MESCQGGEIKTSRGKRMIANAVISGGKKKGNRGKYTEKGQFATKTVSG